MNHALSSAPATVHYLPNAGDAPFPKPGPGRNPKSVTSLRGYRFQRELRQHIAREKRDLEGRIQATIRAVILAMRDLPDIRRHDEEPVA